MSNIQDLQITLSALSLSLESFLPMIQLADSDLTDYSPEQIYKMAVDNYRAIQVNCSGILSKLDSITTSDEKLIRKIRATLNRLLVKLALPVSDPENLIEENPGQAMRMICNLVNDCSNTFKPMLDNLDIAIEDHVNQLDAAETVEPVKQVEARKNELVELEGEWSNPMSKTRMMGILDIDTLEKFNSFAERQGIVKVNRSLHKLRLDGLRNEQKKRLKEG